MIVQKEEKSVLNTTVGCFQIASIQTSVIYHKIVFVEKVWSSNSHNQVRQAILDMTDFQSG